MQKLFLIKVYLFVCNILQWILLNVYYTDMSKMHYYANNNKPHMIELNENWNVLGFSEAILLYKVFVDNLR